MMELQVRGFISVSLALYLIPSASCERSRAVLSYPTIVFAWHASIILLMTFTQTFINLQVHDYMKELTDTLCKSKIIRLDVSGNYLCGKGGREYSGILYLVRKFCCRGGLKALKVRDNRLHSQGCAAVSEGLGVFSALEELDISDNFLGLDPTGRFNAEGVLLLSRQVSQTLGLRILRLARNSLRDEDITHLGEAVCR